MTLEEGTLIDISLNSNSYYSNSSTDLYDNQQKIKKKCFNKWCICFTIICGLSLTALFIFDVLKENVK